MYINECLHTKTIDNICLHLKFANQNKTYDILTASPSFNRIQYISGTFGRKFIY